MKDFEIICYDNTIENKGISERYNSFIDTIKADDNYWVAFLHQDFIFNENPIGKLEKLDKNCLYGAVGIARMMYFAQFKPKFVFKPKFYRRCLLGQIYQGAEDRLVGNWLSQPRQVDTFDCCCCIVHSSLLRDKELRYDENLKFHMYVEDLCHSAKKLGILSKVTQFDCCHLSSGNMNEELDRSAKYVKEKHKLKLINSTCYK